MNTLRAVVAEKPGFVYEPPDGPDGGCMYVHEDEHGRQVPGCLVGHVYNRLGASLDALSLNEGHGPSFVASDPAVRLDLSFRALHALAEAQKSQDMGDTWSEALGAAEREFERQ
ncbi:hypothetical protein [Streptomyces decoyicus]